jgi:hypothetical protein
MDYKLTSSELWINYEIINENTYEWTLFIMCHLQY